MKYPPLQEPCKSCIYKCFRVEEPTFIKAEKEDEIKQERIKI